MPQDTGNSDAEWLEHLSESGRKFYENTTTHEIRWKPPRKRNQRHSYPPAIENNVGIILSKGDLRIANVYNDKKKKYKMATGYLTSTHFLYTKKDKSNDYFRKIPLYSAQISQDGRKNVYVLKNPFHTIRFKSKEPEIAEIWFHDLRNVIESLNAESKSLPTRSLCRNANLSSSFKENCDTNQNFPALRKSVLNVISEEIVPKFPTPPGWIAKFDSSREQYVYVSEYDYSEEWTSEALPDGRVYFSNSKRKLESWLLPWQNRETNV